MKPNREQKDIINYFTNEEKAKRVISVEAPPGTGKTYTAVSTCINYINFKLKQDSRYNKKALILTFSKNARAQIEKQLDEMCYSDNNFKRYIEITNFHSFFQKYVWAYSKYIGLNQDLIITSPKQRKKILDERLSVINNYTGDYYQHSWIDSLLEGEFYPLYNGNIRPSVRKIMPYKDDIIKVIKMVNQEGYMGFSDLGYYMNRILDKSPELLRFIQLKYELIILDEYQDASNLQDEIVRKLVGETNKAIFFSDSKQMIYGWRGASSDRIANLFEFYNEEIENMELIESMRFGNKKDIENLINEVKDDSYDINTFESSDNVKYIKIEVEDKNMYSRMNKNKMYSALLYNIKNNLPKYSDMNNKSIGILCRSNEQVEFLQRAFREKFKMHTKIISNNEEEHNIVCDLIDFLESTGDTISKDELSKEISKYIFSVIYDDSIGAIKRNKLDSVSFSNYNNARLPILREIASFIKEADESKNYIKCIYKSINSLINTDLKINYDNMFLLRKILYDSNIKKDRITDLFLQYQYLKSFKKLEGIYILNIHQSKGREFDFVYLIDREILSKEDNLLYVGVSRTKEKLVILDWVQ